MISHFELRNFGVMILCSVKMILSHFVEMYFETETAERGVQKGGFPIHIHQNKGVILHSTHSNNPVFNIYMYICYICNVEKTGNMETTCVVCKIPVFSPYVQISWVICILPVFYITRL